MTPPSPAIASVRPSGLKATTPCRPDHPGATHSEAEAEIRTAIAYYEAQRPGLGHEFRQEFEAATEQFRRMPGAFASIDSQGTRKHRFRRFPYTIYHAEFDDMIWIAAIAHQKRRPSYWSGRAPMSRGDS